MFVPQSWHKFFVHREHFIERKWVHKYSGMSLEELTSVSASSFVLDLNGMPLPHILFKQVNIYTYYIYIGCRKFIVCLKNCWCCVKRYFITTLPVSLVHHWFKEHSLTNLDHNIISGNWTLFQALSIRWNLFLCVYSSGGILCDLFDWCRCFTGLIWCEPLLVGIYSVSPYSL